MTQNLSIAYLNQYLLEHPSLLPSLNAIDSKLPELVYGRNSFTDGHFASWYSRTGKNTMFCKTPGLIEFNKSIPDYSQSFDQSFEQVSDQRCLDLRASHWHKSWVIMWSGGIDSTVLLTSILRNLPPSDFKNIKIWCNNISIYENPRFFINHIKPNFEVISDLATRSMDKDVFLFTADFEYILGLGADRASDAILTGLDASGNDLSWVDNRDKLTAFCSILKQNPSTHGVQDNQNIKFSNWLYNAMAENIRSTGLPITTIREWWWWLLFNLQWNTGLLYHFDQFCGQKNHQQYFENYVPWFHSDGYQLWAVHNLSTIARMKNKSIGKQYIYTIFKDEFYLKFKTKIDSSSLSSTAVRIWVGLGRGETRPKDCDINYVLDDRAFCILNNHECLYLDKDLDRIIELLPEHINLDCLNYL